MMNSFLPHTSPWILSFHPTYQYTFLLQEEVHLHSLHTFWTSLKKHRNTLHTFLPTPCLFFLTQAYLHPYFLKERTELSLVSCVYVYILKNTPLSVQMSASDLDFSLTISRLDKWSLISNSCSTFQYNLSAFTVFYTSSYIKYIGKSF